MLVVECRGASGGRKRVNEITEMNLHDYKSIKSYCVQNQSKDVRAMLGSSVRE